MKTYLIRIDAYCDRGTGLTAQAQGNWAGEVADMLIAALSTIKGAYARRWDRTTVAVSRRNGRGFLAAVTAAKIRVCDELGRKGAYIDGPTLATQE